MKNSGGMQLLARLVAEPGRGLHALGLATAPGQADSADLGPALDHTARNRYRKRLARARRRTGTTFENCAARGKIARIDAELQAFDTELERAFGLAGRTRPLCRQ